MAWISKIGTVNQRLFVDWCCAQGSTIASGDQPNRIGDRVNDALCVERVGDACNTRCASKTEKPRGL